ncbi:BINDING PROTEIN putative-RELATED [Salix viminalis]|uniref:BINDING PROTEIN putative-RELATED n=1 Tax=Salix viminalis TaxID=40686 RepID=A0A9Q0NMY7_SALVM|nr:BINDING PROTEIN putative-RELATED [Salix viminalis]
MDVPTNDFHQYHWFRNIGYSLSFSSRSEIQKQVNGLIVTDSVFINCCSKGGWHNSSRDLDGLKVEAPSSQQVSGNKLDGVGFAQSRSITGLIDQELKNPILEFSLGRPDWQNKEHE